MGKTIKETRQNISSKYCGDAIKLFSSAEVNSPVSNREIQRFNQMDSIASEIILCHESKYIYIFRTCILVFSKSTGVPPDFFFLTP